MLVSCVSEYPCLLNRQPIATSFSCYPLARAALVILVYQLPANLRFGPSSRDGQIHPILAGPRRLTGRGSVAHAGWLPRLARQRWFL